ncbi:hypothetical protein BJV82DRAFT_540049 [Fennellomyces sp. T-0311]|nr:hypothetical protein BJV82DRAFT_540049 [Fennellomyces sp. T-0311]
MSSNVHGRERVKTSEEVLQKRKEKEAIKIKQYNDLVEQCQKQFSNEEYTQETLKLTTRILEMNPDYYTIWNIRRNVLLRGIFKPNAETQEAIDENRSIYKKELDLFMQLIRINPKSYWMWNHRRWCLETMPRPDWMAELGLVEKLLALDARNFHGWSYRRYVVKQLRKDATGKEEDDKIVRSEYDFTTKKINESFSNFSAWHQRTKLLPQIVQGLSAEERNQIAKNGGLLGFVVGYELTLVYVELYMVKEAIYTEPDDQSAWLYYRWIIGHLAEPIMFLGAYTFAKHFFVVLLFDDEVFLKNPPKMLDGAGNAVDGSWVSGGSGSSGSSTVWIFKPVNTKCPTKVRIEPANLVPSTLSRSTPTTVLEEPIVALEESNDFTIYSTQLSSRFESQTPPNKQPLTFPSLSDSSAWHTLDPITLLREEIATVRELLDIEPDSKWALQTLAHFIEQLKLRGGYNSQAAISDALGEVIRIYEQLATLDTYRKNRYHDARNRTTNTQRYLSMLDKNEKKLEADAVYDIISKALAV